MVEVAELRGISLQNRALERCGNIDLDKGNASESYKALKILYKEDDIFIIHVFFY